MRPSLLHMKFIHSITALLLLSSSPGVFAIEVIGQAWGATEEAAKLDALADISSRISVTVRNQFKTVQTVNSVSSGKQKAEAVAQASVNLTESYTELPILGASFSTRSENQQVRVSAVLESSVSLPLYLRRLDDLRTRIAAANTRVQNTKPGEAQYHDIMDILTMVEVFKKLSTVATYLGANPPGYAVDEGVLKNQLRASIKNVESLDLAARLLSAGMNEAGIYLYPAKARNSNEITPFASLLKDKLAVYIKSSIDPRQAAYTFIGDYQESDEGIDITYQLVDRTATARKTNSVHIAKKAYVGMRTTPTSADFEQLLQTGVVVSGDLRVDISSNLGKRNLVFNEDTEVELFVKLSDMGYFYVVGYTIKDNEKNSYLLEIHEAPGNRKFLHFVNADDANKWISIGKFKVTPPFGVESLQVVSPTKI
jgi:hypothetical protein